jgi:hypothetical protein
MVILSSTLNSVADADSLAVAKFLTVGDPYAFVRMILEVGHDNDVTRKCKTVGINDSRSGIYRGGGLRSEKSRLLACLFERSYIYIYLPELAFCTVKTARTISPKL